MYFSLNFRNQEDTDALEPATEGCDFSVLSFEQDFTDSRCEDSESTNCYSVSSTPDEVSSDDKNCGDKVIFSSSFSFFFCFLC